MSDATMIRLQIEPGAQVMEIASGTLLAEIFDLAHVDFAYPCGRARLCGKCRIQFDAGAPEPTEEEKKKLSFTDIEKGVRLACCTILKADATVRLPIREAMRTEHILDRGIKSDVVVDPEVRKYRVDLMPSTLQKPVSDWVRLVQGLPESVRGNLNPGLEVLHQLPALVKEAETKKSPLTVTVSGDEVIKVACGDTTAEHYGVAVDIGTTTIAAVLVDLNTGEEIAKNGCLNPQTDFGFDLISRIHAVLSDPANLKALQERAICGIGKLILQMCGQKGINADDITAITLAGNTLMTHLLLGVDPSSLGQAPFAGTMHSGVCLEARELGFPIHPRAFVYVFPCIGGFVGGDIVADILVANLQQQSGISILADIGTNGEVVICDNGKLFSTSSAAGPAFEGGKISCGMMARDGAMDHIAFDGTDFRISTLNNKPMRGVCGSGLIEAFARSVETGLLGMNGRISNPSLLDGTAPAPLIARLQPEENGSGRIMLDPANHERDALFLTQADVREFQLGKGAVNAAIHMVMAEVGITLNQIDRLLVAGAFGNHLNIADAMSIGLLPEMPQEKVFFIGNGSLEGARCVLLNRYERERAEQIADATKWVELAHRPEFQERFAMAMLLGPMMDL